MTSAGATIRRIARSGVEVLATDPTSGARLAFRRERAPAALKDLARSAPADAIVTVTGVAKVERRGHTTLLRLTGLIVDGREWRAER